MPRRVVSSPDAPKALGPYSQAVDSDPFVFLAGQTPVDPATGQLVEGDITVQTERVFDNLFAVLAAAGLTPDDVVKVNCYLTDLPNDFAAMPGRYMDIVLYGCGVGVLLLLISRPVTRLMGGVK